LLGQLVSCDTTQYSYANGYCRGPLEQKGLARYCTIWML